MHNRVGGRIIKTVFTGGILAIYAVAYAAAIDAAKLPRPLYPALPSEIAAQEALINVSESAQVVGPNNFRMNFEIPELLPGGGDNPLEDRRGFSGKIDNAEGLWSTDRGRAPQYNTATHHVGHGGLKVEGTRMTGDLLITIKPDNWVPADKQEREMRVTVDAVITRSDQRAPETGDAAESRWWHIMASDAAAPVFEVNGTSTFSCFQSGQQATSPFSGSLTQPVGVNKWNMGNPDNGGVAFDFNMGTNRVNWNHARMAQAQFDPVRDLSAWQGLRFVVETAEPRNDAQVSVWLGEADGSWYYIKGAIPLSAATNEIYLPFADFAEAEWVAPSSHVDEDYVLDLTAIAQIGVGVVNPLGVGDVAFTLREIDLVRWVEQEVEPARLVVSGKTLAVNEHEMVPPGLFGGYAPNLPQRYRPGCQRDLRTLPGGGPSLPRIIHYRLRNADLPDPLALLAALDEARQAEEDSVLKHIINLFPENNLRRFPGNQRSAIERTLQQERNDFRALTDPLNSTLSNPGFYDAAIWPAEVTDRLGERFKRYLEKHPNLNTQERFVFHRALLTAALPELVAEPPAHEPTEAFYIDCMGDRFQACPVVRNPTGWRQGTISLGNSYAAAAKAAEQDVVLEIWNEPYLNWAVRPGEHLKVQYYDEARAVEGGAVTLKGTDKVIPHFRWRKTDGGNWEVYDETQFTYWSGRGNGYIYDLYARVLAEAVKEVNEDVKVIAGWGFRWNEDHWAAWDMLYRPTIDNLWDVIDGLHEHHYQGDTTAMNGSYELATAYAMTRYNKWLYSYNTEVNDLLDAPARGHLETPEMVKAATDYRRMTYNIRDILYCILQSPDKKKGRTVIHYNQTRSGMDIAYGAIMLNLRGRLVETASSDPHVWVVSSIDGTDPRAMPPDFEKPELVVLVFNDHREARSVTLDIHAPDGTVFTGKPLIQRTALDRETMRAGLIEQPLELPAGATTLQQEIELTERSVWKITLPLEGELVADAQVERQQFFAPDLLNLVQHDKPFSTNIRIDRRSRRQAARAWLRLVVEDVHEGEGEVRVGDQVIALPRALTADNVNRIIELPLDVAALGRNNTLEFSVPDNRFPGYRVQVASIVVESR